MKILSKRVRRWVYCLLFTSEIESRLERWTNGFLLSLILANVIAVIVSTEPGLPQPASIFLQKFEIVSIVIFTFEFFLRVWSIVEDERYSQALTGRLRYILTPLAIIDLVAILPFFLPTRGLDLRFLRAVRLFRIFRLLKLSRYSTSLRMLGKVIRAKRSELGVVLYSVAILLVIASAAMYYLEHDAQPEVFSSILSSLWWGVATLTTVGYGDIYPKTILGKFLGSVIAVLGIGLFALPTGIIASGFSEELHGEKDIKTCPHCGIEL